MKVAIISDIHGNGDALRAVLADIEAEQAERLVCLGDVVGYGAEPGWCVAALRERGVPTVAGNHDYAAIGKTNINYFNAYAREATLWTRRMMSEEDRTFLANLPLVEVQDGFTMVHGTLYAPELFDYILTTYDAYLSLQLLETPVCFLGHSHVPINFVWDETVTFHHETDFVIREGQKVLVNVGSVGQPRDDNPDACYAIYETEERRVRIKRVKYDVEAAARRIREAGLPAALGERLKVGR
ncbi:MAG: metallophosphatase family protein [Planctomycetota bacterium]|nr:MAG: metallophosphatase family protein [Planctomycetota bacterium]